MGKESRYRSVVSTLSSAEQRRRSIALCMHTITQPLQFQFQDKSNECEYSVELAYIRLVHVDGWVRQQSVLALHDSP